MARGYHGLVAVDIDDLTVNSVYPVLYLLYILDLADGRHCRNAQNLCDIISHLIVGVSVVAGDCLARLVLNYGIAAAVLERSYFLNYSLTDGAGEAIVGVCVLYVIGVVLVDLDRVVAIILVDDLVILFQIEPT